MPLNEGAKPGSKGFSENVATEIRSGKERKQAVAIAYSEAKKTDGEVLMDAVSTLRGKVEVAAAKKDGWDKRIPPSSHLLKEKPEDPMWRIRGISMSGGKSVEVKVRAKDYSEARENAGRRGIKIESVLKLDAEQRIGNSTAETERKWRIRGVYPDGKKLEFSVLAFDYSSAKKKAEARKGGAKITDIVLKD